MEHLGTGFLANEILLRNVDAYTQVWACTELNFLLQMLLTENLLGSWLDMTVLFHCCSSLLQKPMAKEDAVPKRHCGVKATVIGFDLTLADPGLDVCDIL